MVKQWLTNFRMTGPIEYTSLVTRIASNMGVLDGNPVPFIEEPRVMIDEAYLVQGHTHKKGPDDSLIFFCLGYAKEILLPNVGYHLYNCHSLTTPLVPQEESRRQSVSGLPGRVTRSRAKREEFQQPNLSLNHSNTRLEVRHGRVPAPLSGHGRPQGAGPPAPVPVKPRSLPDVQLRPEVSPL